MTVKHLAVEDVVDGRKILRTAQNREWKAVVVIEAVANRAMVAGRLLVAGPASVH
jgi:hypothetical protein